MSKGEQTRERILARSAQLFNRQGYFGSSLTDIMRETGLEKGGFIIISPVRNNWPWKRSISRMD